MVGTTKTEREEVDVYLKYSLVTDKLNFTYANNLLNVLGFMDDSISLLTYMDNQFQLDGFYTKGRGTKDFIRYVDYSNEKVEFYDIESLLNVMSFYGYEKYTELVKKGNLDSIILKKTYKRSDFQNRDKLRNDKKVFEI